MLNATEWFLFGRMPEDRSAEEAARERDLEIEVMKEVVSNAGERAGSPVASGGRPEAPFLGAASRPYLGGAMPPSGTPGSKDSPVTLRA